MAFDQSVEAFVNPLGIAIVGASRTPGKLGHILATNLLSSGYRGAVQLINPSGGDVNGVRMYRSIEEVPSPLDLVVILVPAPATPEILELCGNKGARGAILAAAGFREAGAEGAELEKQCVHVAHLHGMRLLGPNCLGIADNVTPFNTTFLPAPGPRRGNVALLSQSGAMCAAAIDKSLDGGWGFSRLVSLGNKADLSESDFLSGLAADAETSVVMLYLEGIPDGRKFVESARDLTAVKPLVAFHVGRSDEGRRAATSHTGSLAGPSRIIDAAFRKGGITAARTTRDLFDFTRAFAGCPLPSGNRIGILSNAGGPGVAATDALVQLDLRLATLSEETRNHLADFLPGAAVTGNPVDMLATATGDQYAKSLGLLLSDPGVDAGLVILPAPPHIPPDDVIRGIVPVVKSSDKPVLVVPLGGKRLTKAIELLRESQIPHFDYPEEAVEALAAMWRQSKRWQKSKEIEYRLRQKDRVSIDRLIDNRSGLLPPDVSSEIVAICGIPVVRSLVVGSADATFVAADKIGYPVALKAVARELAHKTEVGGVNLDIGDATTMRDAVSAMANTIESRLGGGSLEGFIVQAIADTGLDLILGGLQDPQFGPVVMFGSGGTAAEAEQDVAFALAPLSETEALELISLTRIGKVFEAYRNRKESDAAAVVSSIVQMGALLAAFPQISECDINPLRVFTKGSGVLALDIKLFVDSAS